MAVLEYFSALKMGYNFDLQTIFFMLGGCLSAAIGAVPKTGVSSGFLKIMDLKCLSKTELVLGK